MFPASRFPPAGDMAGNSSPVSVLDLPAFSDSAPFQTAVKQASYVTPTKPRGAVIAAPPLRVLRVCCGFVDSYAHFELQIARADDLEYSLIRSHADVLSLCRLLGCEPPPQARELPIFLNGLIAECEAHTLLEALHDTVPVALPESLATAAPATVPAVLHTGFWALHLKTLLVRWFLDGMQHFVDLRAPCPTLASAGSGLTRHVTIDQFFEINKRTLERRRGAAAQHLQASWRGLLARRRCAQALEAAVNEPLPDPSPATRGRGGAFAIAVASILLHLTTLSGDSTMHACNTSEVCNAQPAVGPNHSTDIEVTVSTCASTYAPMQRACARLRRRSSDDNASLVDIVPFTDACEAVKRACGE